MSLCEEEENFIKMIKIILEIVPKHLRSLFIEKWDLKYPSNKWQSGGASGNFLFNEIPNAAKNGRNRVYALEMKSGNESDWDTTTLLYAILYSQLNLIPSCRPDGQGSVPLLISKEIDILRKVRNEFFAHASSMQCLSAAFIDITSKIQAVAKNVFGANAENEIIDIVKSQITTMMTDKLKQQLIVEENRNVEFENFLKGNLTRMTSYILYFMWYCKCMVQ